MYCLRTSRRPLVNPVDKGTDTGKHSEVVGSTVLVAPTHSTTQNPSATLVANKRAATVSLKSKMKAKCKYALLTKLGQYQARQISSHIDPTSLVNIAKNRTSSCGKSQAGEKGSSCPPGWPIRTEDSLKLASRIQP